MSAVGTFAPGFGSDAAASDELRSGVASTYRAECRKLAAQLSTRLLALVCLLGPFAFAAVVGAQTGTPADTLFGALVHSSGFAVALVVLGFAGSWGLPLLAGVLAGDIFSSEDRYGTWKTVLTRSCSRTDLFIGKVLAAFTFALGLLGLTALSSLAAGMMFVGAQPLVGLGGQLLSPGRSLLLVGVSWLLTAFPVIAFTSLALLFSLATRSGIVGVIGPGIVALGGQLLALVGSGVWGHTLLIGSAFDLWHGLFAGTPFYTPLLVSIGVSMVWTAACMAISWQLLRRRDYAGAQVSPGAGWVRPVRVVVVVIVVVALLAVAGNWGPVGDTPGRLQNALATEFNNVSLYQQRLLGRVVPAGARLDVLPYCYRHAGPRQGPGDWSCSVDVFIPQPGKVPFQQTQVTYEVSVQANGCYKAQSPPSFVGQQTMRDSSGGTVVNPLFVIYGCFDPL